MEERGAKGGKRGHLCFARVRVNIVCAEKGVVSIDVYVDINGVYERRGGGSYSSISSACKSTIRWIAGSSKMNSGTSIP
jgi:hypothetical protein